MKKIYVATRARGFLMRLFKKENPYFKFIYDDKKIYETNTKTRMFISRLAKSKIADHMGLIQRVKVRNKECDIVFSYNRFIHSEKDYVIYLENPLALVHYSTNRNKTWLSKMKLKKYFNDPHLKAIICLSKACYNTIHNFYSIPKTIKVDQIYPYIPANSLTNPITIKHKCQKKELKCLYIASNFKLKGGEDILLAFNKLKESGINNIKLTIITKKDSLDKNLEKKINSNFNIKLYDFSFNNEDLNELYNESCILLNPTRQDSFPLVLLEAMKSGNAIITTDLYAITEMVENNYNGYLTYPKYRFFNYDNIPNEAVWNNRNKTIYSDYIDINIVDFLYKKLTYLNENRDILESMALNSFNKSNSGEFSEDFIIRKWKDIFFEI